MRYPEFACQCCGLTNGDMYCDWWLGKTGQPPNDAAWEVYLGYQCLYDRLNELEKKIEELEQKTKKRPYKKKGI